MWIKFVLGFGFFGWLVSFVLSLSFTKAVFLSCRLIGSSFLSVLVNLKSVFVLKASYLIRFAHPSGRLSGAQRFAFVFYLCKRK